MVTKAQLEDASNKGLIESAEAAEVEEDAKIAMNQIDEFNNLGYNFREKPQ